MRPRPSIIAGVLLAALSLLALSCSRDSGSQTGVPASKLAAEANSKRSPTVAPEPHSQWQQFDDPSRDGWSSEVFAEAASKKLERLGKWIENPQTIALEGLEEIALPQFRCKPLLPATKKIVFDSPYLQVERSSAETEESKQRAFEGPTGLGDAIRQLASRFAGATDIRTKFKIFKVLPQGDTMLTEQYVELSGKLSEGILEQHATWQALWDRRDATAPRLLTLRLVDFEQVRSRQGSGPLFADCTESVIGHNAAYEAQMLRGMNHWLLRIPNSGSLANFGHPGLAVGDVDGNGLEDLYVCQEQGLPNRLFLQNEDGTADEVSTQWGVDWLQNTRSALLIDLDNDGDQDLVLGILGGIALVENENGQRFQLRQVLPISKDVTSLSAADFDQDGDLDIYAAVYYADDVIFSPDEAGGPASARNLVYHDANIGGRNALLRNDISTDSWNFVDATKETGLQMNNQRYSLASAWEDFDNDGDQDLYVANDYGRDSLYENQQGHFEDIGDAAGAENAASGMSVTWSDLDHDGWMDAYVGNMWSSAGNRIAFQPEFKADAEQGIKDRLQRFARGNTLLHNNQDQTLSDISEDAGVAMGRWAWSSQLADINNDGWEDILIANGYLTGDDAGGDL